METHDVAPDITLVRFRGRVTLGRESQRIEVIVKDLLAQKKNKIVFDLTEVAYIDSTGLGIITFCSAEASAAGGALRVVAQGLPEKLFRVTKLDEIIRFFPTAAEACRDFSLAAPGN